MKIIALDVNSENSKLSSRVKNQNCGVYYLFDADKKTVNHSPMTFEQLREKILALQIKKLEKSFA